MLVSVTHLQRSYGVSRGRSELSASQSSRLKLIPPTCYNEPLFLIQLGSKCAFLLSSLQTPRTQCHQRPLNYSV